MFKLLIILLFIITCGCGSRDWHSSNFRGFTEPIPTEETPLEIGVDKAVNNIDKFDGLSLTGKSFGRFDYNFNPYRYKIGVVGVPSAGDVKTRNEEEIYRHIYNQNRHMTLRNTIFGFGFRKEF